MCEEGDRLDPYAEALFEQEKARLTAEFGDREAGRLRSAGSAAIESSPGA